MKQFENREVYLDRSITELEIIYAVFKVEQNQALFERRL
jgi:hypothetical protein